VRAQWQPQSGGVTVDDQGSRQSAHAARSGGWPASARARAYRLPGQPGFEVRALGRSRVSKEQHGTADGHAGCDQAPFFGLTVVRASGARLDGAGAYKEHPQ
jgi:hypothetical protein